VSRTDSLLAFVAATALSAGSATAASAATPAAKIRWERSFSAAMKKAKAERKAVMIDFWAEWCGWCHELDKTTYADKEVIEAARNLVAVKIDTEGSRAEAKVAAQYRVESLPTIAFISPQGRPLVRVNGFQDAGQFLRVLEQVRKTADEVMGWEAALETSPNDAAALAQLGAHLFDAEYYEEGRDLLKRAFAADKDRPAKERKRTRTLLGIIQHFDNKLTEAETLLKASLELKPADPEEDPATMYTLGKTYLKAGRTKEARATLEQLVSTYPQSKPAARAKDTLADLPRP
jgi:thioredoxin-like negative regulator of GroEL